MELNIFCADLGSVARGNFGWFGRLTTGQSASGTDMPKLATAVSDRLNRGEVVALGFEAPMFVPFRDDPARLTKRRNGETNPNWIGGPGSAVLATGLAQVPWILREMKSKMKVTGRPTLRWEVFAAGEANLLLWEAFVSGSAKGRDHVDDARIAVNAFRKVLPNPVQKNAISEPVVTCLVGAALLRTGWASDVGLLAESCLVIKA